MCWKQVKWYTLSITVFLLKRKRRWEEEREVSAIEVGWRETGDVAGGKCKLMKEWVLGLSINGTQLPTEYHSVSI